MELIKDKSFGGERPLFATRELRLENVTVTDGESAIKHGCRIECYNSKFHGRYPLWHIDDLKMEHCYFAPEARSAVWYSNNVTMDHCTIDAPKIFREAKYVNLTDVSFNDADEVFWKVSFMHLRNIRLHGGAYPFMFSDHMIIDGLETDSKYVFQYCRNVEVHNAKITTKDAFWECENATIYDSVLDGEYLGWHSKNIRLVNCHLSGEQLFCYTQNLILENCTFDKSCDRLFEYSTVFADIKGHVEHIKNPTSGRIVADSIGSVTIDENVQQPNNCVIETRR